MLSKLLLYIRMCPRSLLHWEVDCQRTHDVSQGASTSASGECISERWHISSTAYYEKLSWLGILPVQLWTIITGPLKPSCYVLNSHLQICVGVPCLRHVITNMFNSFTQDFRIIRIFCKDIQKPVYWIGGKTFIVAQYYSSFLRRGQTNAISYIDHYLAYHKRPE
jgi:hypothetical protein